MVRNSNLLIVDDNRGDLRLIEEAFRASELSPTIHAMKTKDEALEFISQRNKDENAPGLDVALLDWNLSPETSEEVVVALKSVDPHLPVVVMTGSDVGLELVKSAVPQVDTYIEKPTTPDCYIELLRPYLTGQ